MKKLAYFVLIFSIFVFVASIGIYFISSNPIEVREIDASVNITLDSGGFDLNSSSLTFGNIALGGSSTRRVLFNNGYEFPVTLEISTEGNISEIISYDKVVHVDKGESKYISFSAVSTEEANFGHYSGIVKIKVFVS